MNTDANSVTTQRPALLPTLIAWVLTFAGAALLIAGIVTGLRALVLFERPHTQAEVIEVRVSQSKTDSKGQVSDLYSPTVRYTVDGRVHVYASSGAISHPYRVGDIITVSYDPKHPERGAIVGMLWFTPVLLLAIGVIMSGVAWGVRHLLPIGTLANLFGAGRLSRPAS